MTKTCSAFSQRGGSKRAEHSSSIQRGERSNSTNAASLREKFWLRIRFLDRITGPAIHEDGKRKDDTTILSDDSIKILTAAYNDKKETFSFQRHIKDVYTLLNYRGVPFYDHRFDWCVIFTLLWRLDTNSITMNRPSPQPTYTITAPRFSFFNHSCNPNVEFKVLQNSTKVELKALKSIGKDSECFVSVLSAGDLKSGVWERRESLKQWFGDDCMCYTCVAEGNDEAAAAAADADTKRKLVSQLIVGAGKGERGKRK